MTTTAHAFDTLEADGFAIAHNVVTSVVVKRIIEAVASIDGVPRSDRRSSRNARGLLESCREVADLAGSQAIRQLVEPVIGKCAFPVRGILFDKVVAANWHVGWHQDQVIPVQVRVETPGFTAWSVKQGIDHVRPPAEVLAGMLTLRVHLDDCAEENGPLEMIPGTHQSGLLDADEISTIVASRRPVVCAARAGDVLLIRPLLLHASRRASTPHHRRVMHLEFAVDELPGELDWHSPTERLNLRGGVLP
ncbi:MAG: phytanoyl-CoA dioxygenase family protein [Aeoliella sp.]